MALWKTTATMMALCAGIIVCGGLRADDQEKPQQKEEKQEPAKDRYAVPDGDTKELMKFIADLRSYRPENLQERIEYRDKFLPALKKAAEKVIALEKETPASPAAKEARFLLLAMQIRELVGASQQQQADYYEDLKGHLNTFEQLSQQELALAYQSAMLFAESGNTKLAVDAYRTFAKRFEQQEDPAVKALAAQMQGSARRLDLPGKEMKITGTSLSGEAFDWCSYRGKVVLVDFWATWCGPCVAEIPNVRRNYERYHDKGFEVVGISLDRNRAALESFVEERKLPWVNLYEEGANGSHPVATYYGINSIPTVMLVDQKGKVVSMAARGPQLDQLLAKLLGDADEQE